MITFPTWGFFSALILTALVVICILVSVIHMANQWQKETEENKRLRKELETAQLKLQELSRLNSLKPPGVQR